ncbi:hypothetical protein AVEN_63211-1 [Araneus ventricosus]|uniref:Uncharacterized protein n=1 Tax=Araneus ventricosus TaxID=182803 RepID=A0A4Y2B3L3_ARAVE|nr:hypothetical protein AVEN_63211-1 [Araneus ventricosus]
MFWDRPRNFEPRSVEEDDISPEFRATPEGKHLAPTDLACTRLAYTAVLQWNRVSNLEPSSAKVETLPPGHHGFRSLPESRFRDHKIVDFRSDSTDYLPCKWA